ncbi:MAG: class I SAM-dependent methyltransferase, partial [Bacteriovoracaceae bacterium]
MSKKKVSKQAQEPFNKYVYYEKAVQNPQNEVDFFNEKFKEIKKKTPLTLREDFCGTAAISCAWVDQSPKHLAWGVDLDPEPIEYGKKNHLSKLNQEAQKRMTYLEGNVLNTDTPKVDIAFAFNFSYYIFKKRKELLEYFKAAYNSLSKDGVFFIDLFGGPDSQTEMTDVITHPGFKYFWECQMFNPITNECRFAIHFKRKSEQKRKDVFVYEWRMWTMMELRELLEEAGFKSTIAY